MPPSVLDLDNQSSWGPAIREIIGEHESRLEKPAGTARERADEDLMDEAARGRRLRTYHCTRLLPHEDIRIREQGLRLLTKDLMIERIESAVDHGHIDHEERRAFHRSHAFATADHQHREGCTYLILGTAAFAETPWRVNQLLSRWGGEAMYQSGSAIPKHRLEQLGKPTIVVVEVVYRPEQYERHSRDLLEPFLRADLGHEDAFTELRSLERIPAEAIVETWTPGHPSYDQFEGLAPA